MNNMINIHDIHKRLKAINRATSPRQDFANEAYAETTRIALENSIPRDLMKTIETVTRNTNPLVLESVLDLFDALYEHGTTGQMVKMANYICEEAVPKVRDAKETNTNLKRKLGRLKSKISTKVSGNIEDAQDEVLGKIHAAGNNFKKNTAAIKGNINKGL